MSPSGALTARLRVWCPTHALSKPPPETFPWGRQTEAAAIPSDSAKWLGGVRGMRYLCFRGQSHSLGYSTLKYG